MPNITNYRESFMVEMEGGIHLLVDGLEGSGFTFIIFHNNAAVLHSHTPVPLLPEAAFFKSLGLASYGV
jgi:hypothetical protein